MHYFKFIYIYFFTPIYNFIPRQNKFSVPQFYANIKTDKSAFYAIIRLLYHIYPLLLLF